MSVTDLIIIIVVLVIVLVIVLLIVVLVLLLVLVILIGFTGEPAHRVGDQLAPEGRPACESERRSASVCCTALFTVYR